MKLFWKIGMVVITALGLAACGGGGGGGSTSTTASTASGIGKGSVVFSVDNNIIKTAGANGSNTLEKANAAVISSNVSEVVVSITNSSNVTTSYTLPLSLVSGSYVTSGISLPIGTYQITSYIVNNASHSALYATPLTGSALAHLVTAPLPVSFTVTANGTVSVAPEIVPTTNASGAVASASFGLGTYNLNLVSTINFFIAPILSPVAPGTNAYTTADITVTSGGTTLYDSVAAGVSLTAGTNSIMIRESATVGATYVVTVSKTGRTSFTHTYTGAELSQYVTNGLGPINATLAP